MKNLTEKLTLMTKLQSLGVEPGMWTGTEGHIYFDNSHQAIMLMVGANEENFGLSENTISELYTAWFPLEQVLELLDTQVDDFANLVMWNFVNGKTTEPFDYHLAALKLLVPVVKQRSEDDE